VLRALALSLGGAPLAPVGRPARPTSLRRAGRPGRAGVQRLPVAPGPRAPGPAAAAGAPGCGPGAGSSWPTLTGGCPGRQAAAQPRPSAAARCCRAGLDELVHQVGLEDPRLVSTTASHAPSLHLPCEPVELEGLQIVELGPGSGSGTVSACGLLSGRQSRTGGRMHRGGPGPEAFYGQIRHRHLLLL